MKINYKIIWFVFLPLILSRACKNEEIPTVTTLPVTEIAVNSAASGGDITDDGGSLILNHGLCWSTDNNPTIDDSVTSHGLGDGVFTSTLTDLSAGTTYYTRAYATNKVGTGYGPEISFTTLGTIPSVSNPKYEVLSMTSVFLSAYASANFLSTKVSFEYGMTMNYGSAIEAEGNPLSGDSGTDVNVTLTGLQPGTEYHFRIKAENSLGITYSNDVVFKTLGGAPIISYLRLIYGFSTSEVTVKADVNSNLLPTLVSFEYGTSPDYGNEIMAKENPIDGNLKTTVSALVSGLNRMTHYNVRAKAVNAVGTTYSDNHPFSTPSGYPIVNTSEPSVNNTDATVKGSVVTYNYSTNIYFEYGLTGSYGTIIPVPDSNILLRVPVSAHITDLIPGTTYHYRLTAKNENGESKSGDNTFMTTITGIKGTVSDIDGNIYPTIGIGHRMWMVTNLKTTHYNDGFRIELVEDFTKWSTMNYGGYCYYNNDSTANKDIYGALYNGYSVFGNICPTGWHVPYGIEWERLFDFVGGAWFLAGFKLMEEGTLHWTNNNGGTNEFGFTALPGGKRDSHDFNSMNYGAYWWTHSNNSDYWSTNEFWGVTINPSIGIGGVNKHSAQQTMGFSVRCIKD